ncbi:hypothetical protein C5Y11_014860, partial [Klebsiella pneumoniae subsp. pneumoniae]
MTEPTNKDSEIKKHLLDLLNSQSENIAKHFYSHIKNLIEAGEFSEAHNNLALIEKYMTREGANKQVISSQADSLIKISRIWAD